MPAIYDPLLLCYRAGTEALPTSGQDKSRERGFHEVLLEREVSVLEGVVGEVGREVAGVRLELY